MLLAHKIKLRHTPEQTIYLDKACGSKRHCYNQLLAHFSKPENKWSKAAIQLFNQQNGKPQKVIYGCVTTAFLWCFLKLENQNLFIDTNYIPLTLTKPDGVLSALQWVLNECSAT